MRARPSRESSCLGKVAYRSWTHAKAVADKLAREKDEHLVPYRCRYCQRWKLGHRPEARIRKDGA